MLNSEDLQSAADKKYTDFSNAVKQELTNKLAANPVIQANISEFERIAQLKAVFDQINKPKEPEVIPDPVPEPTPEPIPEE